MMRELNLAEIRGKIDKIDAEIAKLFEERMNAVHEVAEYKKAKQLQAQKDKIGFSFV